MAKGRLMSKNGNAQHFQDTRGAICPGCGAMDREAVLYTCDFHGGPINTRQDLAVTRKCKTCGTEFECWQETTTCYMTTEKQHD